MTRGAGRGARRRRAGAAALFAAAALLVAAGAADTTAHGQDNDGDAAGIRAPLPAASVPSVTVTIFEDGGVSVEHKVSGSGEARAVRLLGSAVDGAAAEDGDGGRAVGIEVVSAGDGAAVEEYEASEDGLHVVVPPSGGDLLVRYGLEGAMRLAEPSTYSWSFLYRATTSFVLPDVVDVAFVNGQAVRFEGARAFTCHGCQMELEFTAGEQKGVQRFELGGGGAGQDGPRRFDVGVWTSAQVGPLAFDPASMSIAYEAGGVSEAGGRWVTLVVPPGLLGPPYRAEAGGESVPLTTFDAGDGRTGVSVRPAEDGEVRIFGSTAAAAAAAAAPPAGAPAGGGSEEEEEAAAGAETRYPGTGEPGEWGAAIAAAAAAAAGLGGAVAYTVLARRRRA